MTRVGRKYVAWLCLSALLFLQIAVAAYACPLPMNDRTAAIAAADAPATPCPDMDQERPNLCEQHCLQGSQSVDVQPHSSIGTPNVRPMIVRGLAGLSSGIKPNAHGSFRFAVVEPPPLIRFGVLRI